MKKITRRNFVKNTAIISPLIAFPSTGLGGKNFSFQEQKVRVGIVGCGGRGTADMINCLNSAPNVELTAMGDLFEESIKTSYERIMEKAGDKVNVPEKNKFTGFDSYEGVLSCDLDLVLLTSPPVYRPIHLKAAIDANKHVFMEKPIAVDPIGVRSVMASSELADKKGLTILGGTQMRKAKHIKNAMNQIHSGEIGDIVGGQCCRLGGAMRSWGPPERKPEWSDMEWQIRNWYFYTWGSGDFITEMHIHNLDLINWAFNTHPVSCIGFGGRQARTGPVTGKWGNIYDHFTVEYLYPGDIRIEYIGTQIDNSVSRNDQRIVGTKGSVYIDFRKAIVNKQEINAEGNSSIEQHALQIEAIRKGLKLNDGKQVSESTMSTLMGRMCCYTGKEVKWDWIMNESQCNITPEKFEFGSYPFPEVAIPGVTPLV